MRSDTAISTAGYFQLSWEAGAAKSYTVQQSQDATFENAKTIYQGGDVKTVISGMHNGQYFYRMQANNGPWSETVEVVVKHHSLHKAFAFFAAGALMLIILLIVLVRGYKHAQN